MTTRLIRKASELDLDFIVDDTHTNTHTTRRLRHKPTTETEELEEQRLLALLGSTSESSGTSLRSRILNSQMSDLNKAKCLQLARQYSADRENNGALLVALETTMRLPTRQHSLDLISAGETDTDTEHHRVVTCLNGALSAMDQSVYGQATAKSEVLEYLAAKILFSTAAAVSHTVASAATARSRVLGLVGPPGVGKTTLAINGIAKALGLPIVTLSIGGLRDVTYFNGSFRCWKGAHQGRFADALIEAGCTNPIIYIDELDKIATETAQDIYGMLTHATDPLTNSKIHDHFLDVDLDLSGVTFIFSYNDASVIPAPLRERIREVHLNGYDPEQRIIIARDYIIPECLRELNLRQVTFTTDIISYINTRAQDSKTEEGVRGLKKCYQGILSKLALQVLSDRELYSGLTGRVQKAHTVKPRFMPYRIPHIKRLPHVLTREEADVYFS